MESAARILNGIMKTIIFLLRSGAAVLDLCVQTIQFIYPILHALFLKITSNADRFVSVITFSLFFKKR